MPVLISVVVPTYQRRESLRRLLLAFAQQTLAPEKFEIIVSIDGSEDGTREMIAGFSAPYKLRGIWNAHGGRANTANQGVRAAEGDLLVILDDDMEPTEHFLAGHLEGHQSAKAEGREEVCVLGAVPIRYDERSSSVVQIIGGKHADHVKKLSQPGYEIQMRDFYTGNISMRRDIFLNAGGFDDNFKVYGNEDLELYLRLTKAGVSVLYSTQALAYQHYEKDFDTLVQDRIAAGRTAVQLVRKHPGARDSFLMKKYRQTTLRWRFLRWILLQITRLWSGLSTFIVRFVKTVSRIWPATFRFLAPPALDYIYWVSACSEMRSQDAKPTEK